MHKGHEHERCPLPGHAARRASRRPPIVIVLIRESVCRCISPRIPLPLPPSSFEERSRWKDDVIGTTTARSRDKLHGCQSWLQSFHMSTSPPALSHTCLPCCFFLFCLVVLAQVFNRPRTSRTLRKVRASALTPKHSHALI